MIELKTLKDIEMDCMDIESGENDEYRFDYIDKKELKHVAINWYKDMEAEQPYGDATKHVMMWVKIFFNLTEEELK